MINNLKKLGTNDKGMAVVEAAIVFPIFIMVFFALFLLSVYLPSRTMLQRATQYAATALATERSDTWLYYDEGGSGYAWIANKSDVPNVYMAMVNSYGSGNKEADRAKAQAIVESVESTGFFNPPGILTVEYDVVNYIVYKEIIVTATRSIKMPVNLTFVGFPESIDFTVTSVAVVLNGDEFIRSVDFVVDLLAIVNVDVSVLGEMVAEGLGFFGIGD